MKSKEELQKRLEFLEKHYEITKKTQGLLDLYDEQEAHEFDRMVDFLEQTKIKINTLEWVLSD